MVLSKSRLGRLARWHDVGSQLSAWAGIKVKGFDSKHAHPSTNNDSSEDDDVNALKALILKLALVLWITISLPLFATAYPDPLYAAAFQDPHPY